MHPLLLQLEQQMFKKQQLLTTLPPANSLAAGWSCDRLDESMTCMPSSANLVLPL
jgi:hypothetical protein